jgi:hypothetical protein
MVYQPFAKQFRRSVLRSVPPIGKLHTWRRWLASSLISGKNLKPDLLREGAVDKQVLHHHLLSLITKKTCRFVKQATMSKYLGSPTTF